MRAARNGSVIEVVRQTVLGAVLLLLAGTPARGQGRDAGVVRGEGVYVAQGCYGCHLVGKKGTPIGPDLSRVGAKYSASYLGQWLGDPASVRPSAHMPKLELTAQEIESLAAYLATLK